MSKNIDNGGSAFPCEVLDYCESTIFSGEAKPVYKKAPGMTLRDYFAAHASYEDIIHHRFSNPDGSERKPSLTIEQAKWEYADAMIKARGKE